MFQRSHFIVTDNLEHRPDAVYPDLSEVGVGTALVDGKPAVRLSTPHPYPRGFVAIEDGVQHELMPQDPVWPLRNTLGEHVTELAVRTAYGRLPGRPLRYIVR